MEFDELKTLLSIGSKWMVSLNGLEFVPLDSSEISIEGSTIQLGPHKRFISGRTSGIGNPSSGFCGMAARCDHSKTWPVNPKHIYAVGAIPGAHVCRLL